MGAFWGCIVIATVLAYWLWRFFRIFLAFGIVFEKAVNLSALRNGHEPVTTPADEEQFR